MEVFPGRIPACLRQHIEVYNFIYHGSQSYTFQLKILQENLVFIIV